MVRLVCELGIQLQMRPCDCNGAAVCTFWSVVIGVCLVRYVMSAVGFVVLTLCVSLDCVFELL